MPERMEEFSASGCDLPLKPVVADKLRASISQKMRGPTGGLDTR